MHSIIIVGLSVILTTVAHAETHTKSWYVAHPTVRARVNEICANDPGNARNNAECINSAAAEETAAADRIINHHTQTLFDVCDDMPQLFQLVNHCGHSVRK